MSVDEVKWLTALLNASIKLRLNIMDDLFSKQEIYSLLQDNLPFYMNVWSKRK